jgi:hypothetical protein
LVVLSREQPGHTEAVPRDAVGKHSPCEFRQRLEQVVKLRHPQFTSVTDFALKAGVSKSTVTNALTKAEKAGGEPDFDTKTLRKLAGKGRVSLSWLEGTGRDISATDVPAEPTVSAQEIALKRLGGANSEVARLRAENRELRKRLKQYEKR